MGSRPKAPPPPPPPPPPPAPPPPPPPVAIRTVKQAKSPSRKVSGAAIIGSMARLSRNKEKKTGTSKVQGRLPLGGGSRMYRG